MTKPTKKQHATRRKRAASKADSRAATKKNVSLKEGVTLRILFELLRVYSPSAQVKGHGPGQEVLQTGKRDVLVTGMAPVGHYAIQPTFSDGHDSGIYTWDYLYFLGSRQQALWQEYEQRLAAAGAHRDDAMPETAGRSCGSH